MVPSVSYCDIVQKKMHSFAFNSMVCPLGKTHALENFICREYSSCRKIKCTKSGITTTIVSSTTPHELTSTPSISNYDTYLGFLDTLP